MVPDTQRSFALLLTAPGRLQWVPEDLPPLQADQLLVQTVAGAISIGAELPQYRGTMRSSTPPPYPHMTGYESLGTVIACGPAVKRFRVGDRAVAFYGHRTHAVVPEAKAIPVPGGVSDELALLVILTCDVAKGIRKVDPKAEEAVLVAGAGAIGLLTIFMLRADGTRMIDVIEPRRERHALALLLGARAAVLPEELASSPAGYDAGFECSARSAAFELLQKKLRQGGRICILSDGNLEPLALASDFHEKELLVVGSSDGWDYHEHARWYFDYVRERPYGLERVFDHNITARELAATFEDLATGRIAPTKVLVRYNA